MGPWSHHWKACIEIQKTPLGKYVFEMKFAKIKLWKIKTKKKTNEFNWYLEEKLHPLLVGRSTWIGFIYSLYNDFYSIYIICIIMDTVCLYYTLWKNFERKKYSLFLIVVCLLSSSNIMSEDNIKAFSLKKF